MFTFRICEMGIARVPLNCACGEESLREDTESTSQRVLHRAAVPQTYCSPGCQLKKKPHLAENEVKSRSERGEIVRALKRKLSRR